MTVWVQVPPEEVEMRYIRWLAQDIKETAMTICGKFCGSDCADCDTAGEVLEDMKRDYDERHREEEDA